MEEFRLHTGIIQSHPRPPSLVQRPDVPTLLFGITFWQQMGLCDRIGNISQFFTFAFDPGPTPNKIRAIKNHLIPLVRERLKLEKNTQHLITLRCLQTQLQTFDEQLSPLPSHENLINFPHKKPHDLQDLDRATLESARIWICQRTQRWVKWVTTPLDDTPVSANNQDTRSGSPNIKGAPVAPRVLRLESVTTYSRNAFNPEDYVKILLIHGNGDMFLLPLGTRIVNYTECFPIAYCGIVKINLEGKLESIKALDREYPITDQHTHRILSHLEHLGLDINNVEVRANAKINSGVNMISHNPNACSIGRSAKRPLFHHTLASIEQARAFVERERKRSLGHRYEASSNSLADAQQTRASTTSPPVVAGVKPLDARLDDVFRCVAKPSLEEIHQKQCALFLEKIVTWCSLNDPQCQAPITIATLLLSAIRQLRSGQADMTLLSSLTTLVQQQLNAYTDVVLLSQSKTAQLADMLQYAPWAHHNPKAHSPSSIDDEQHSTSLDTSSEGEKYTNK